MKKIILSLAIALSSCCLYAQNTFLSSGDAILGAPGYVGNALQFQGSGEAHFIRTESIGNSGNGHTRLRMYLGDDWSYDQGFEVIANRWDGLQRSLFYIPGNGDNASFYSGASFGGNVGIGTTTPTEKLNAIGNIRAEGAYPYLNLYSTGWTSNTYIQNGVDPIGSTGGDYLSFLNPSGKGFAFSEGSTNMMMIGTNGNVLIGKTSQGNTGYKLDINGSARANEIVVNTTGADFVFDKKYTLPKLSDVKAYIDKNQHLPEIPSAKEMQANGMSVGEINTKLLQKVEELTLYAIEQQKQIEQLKQKDTQLQSQQQQIDELKSQLAKLIKQQ
ncbi:MAG TPA: hypothetical protein VL442_04885 [Mucilaginibacter sp.]|nr:hypothetical protein [Mucilaginibacter sp.]